MTPQTEIEKLKKERENLKKDIALRLKIAGKPHPDNKLDLEINILVGKALVEQEMAKNNHQLKFDEAGNAVLKQTKDGTLIDVFIDNHKLDVEAFIDSALASQNFIEAAGKESQNNEHCNNGLQQQNYNGNNNNGARPNQSVIDEGNAYLAELGAGGY